MRQVAPGYTVDTQIRIHSNGCTELRGEEAALVGDGAENDEEWVQGSCNETINTMRR